ncbi:MAG: DUF5343 domain-containing protein [Alphaproteobacteria bacterium]|nr:DUF5343 domain-containing protein [Alphaproteobacteria bacterium]
MAAKLPYMVSPGTIPKILEKIQNARRPERFTQDFLETKLGHSGGGARPIIPLLKRMGFLGSDGVPTSLYDQYRNSETQAAAVAEGMRTAFNELFERNEYVYEMNREKLIGLVVEITGAAKDARTTQAIVSTFLTLNELADFEADIESNASNSQDSNNSSQVPATHQQDDRSELPNSKGVELRVGYTINLNLPETSDPEVFNAIFSALRENLLKN